MKKIAIILTCLLVLTGSSLAKKIEEGADASYQRSSLSSIMLANTEEFGGAIQEVFTSIPTPEKYNDHNVGVKVVYPFNNKKIKEADITQFLKDNEVARRLIAKWFERNKENGHFSMHTVQERGNYNASYMDVEIAKKSSRGIASLADAGEELLGNTFFVVNDIRYIDKEKGAQVAVAIFSAVGQAAASVGGQYGQLGKSLADLGVGISDQIAGFTVKTTTYLYQLDWNEESQAIFYQKYWVDEHMNPDTIAARRIAFDSSSEFNLKYIGSYKAKSQKTVTRGMEDPKLVIKKVCTRALDKNLVSLQKEFEVFRLKTPIVDVIGKKYVTAYIGKKEGVTSKSQFEVLEKREDELGNVKYKRVGVIKAEKKKIWDNRFMATQEESDGYELGISTFKVKSGMNLYPGLMIRQIKF